MQQNSKCRLFGDKDERMRHIINEGNKLALKEYKTHIVRSNNPLIIEEEIEIWPNEQIVYSQPWEPVHENETHVVLWNFEIQTDNEILARWANLTKANKKSEQVELWPLLSRLIIE